jgi:adenylate cyclase
LVAILTDQQLAVTRFTAAVSSVAKLLRAPLATGFLVCILVSLAVLGLRRYGGLESLELAAYDWFMRLRPSDPQADPRIVLVTITEQDIQTLGSWPLSDDVLAQTLESVARFGPRAIGVDIYRDLPVPPGNERLQDFLRKNGRIIWVSKFGQGKSDGIPPPKALIGTENVGFNDIVVDPGGVVRRGLLFIDDGVTTATAFALRLALLYLQSEGITLQPDPQYPEQLRLGPHALRALEAYDGPYAAADTRGYQFLLDFKGWRGAFRSVTLTELLSGKIAPEVLRDKIVLVGVTAESVKDHFYTPFSRGLQEDQQTDGVAIHAHIASQLIRLGLGGAAPLKTLNEWQEGIWIVLWAAIGALTGFKVRSPWKFSFAVASGLLAIGFFDFIVFLRGWWLPLVPPALAWFIAAVAITAYLSYRETVERAALMQLFSRHVSKEVAEGIWRDREQFLDGQRPRPQQLVATVLFTDLVGFTSVSEKLPPEELMDWLNECMEPMAREVSAHGGVVEQYTGDAIVAIFGVPIARKNEEEISQDAINAVNCALAMETVLRDLNRDWLARHRPTTAMRMGIYTGPMVAGSLGGADRLEYVVIGDTVNIASRLESFDKDLFARSLASPCRILIGEATLCRLGQRFLTEKIGQVSLKGKEEKISVYRVVGHATEMSIECKQSLLQAAQG